MRFLFVDRILQLIPGQTTRGIKHITSDDHYLCVDEQGKRCFIPAFIGETLGQLAAWNVMLNNDFTLRPVAGIVSSATLHRSAYVGETLLLETHIDSVDDVAVRYHGAAYIGDEEIFRIDSALGPLLPMANFIEYDDVRRQFSEIDRPGPWPYSETDTYFEMELPINTISAPTISMQFDRILNSEPGMTMCAEKRISRAASYFPDHFPHKPVLPMTVLLQYKLNLITEFLKQAKLAEQFRIFEMRKIKMNEFIFPGDVVVCHLKVKQQDQKQLVLGFRSEVCGKRVCVLDVVLLPKGKI